LQNISVKFFFTIRLTSALLFRCIVAIRSLVKLVRLNRTWLFRFGFES